jgi:LisH domain-containing protein ARMC9
MAASKAEARIDRAIADYLAFHGMHRSLSVFVEEVREVRRSKAGSAAAGQSKPSDRLASEMLRFFDEGAKTDFFRMWSVHIPMEAQGMSDSASSIARAGRRLEFYLQIHFAVFPFRRLDRHSGNVPSEAAAYMPALKEYLEGAGKELAKTPEFIAYYALPFVPDPRSHDTFSPLLEPEWLEDLRGQLARFLRDALHGVDSHPPTLYRVFRAAAASASKAKREADSSPPEKGLLVDGADEAPLRLACSAARTVGGAASRVLRAAQRATADADEHGPAAIAVTACGTLRKAAQILRSAILAARPLLHQAESHLPAQQEEERPPAAAPSPRQRSDRWTSPEASGSPRALSQLYRQPLPGPVSSSPGPRLWYQPRSLEQLVWGRVRRDLARNAAAAAAGSVESGRRCCLLLQALRWRITRSKPGRNRRAVLSEWMTGDPLGVHTAAAKGAQEGGESDARPLSGTDGRQQLGPLIIRLLRCPAPAVSESTCRLVNAMTSERIGRVYCLRAPAVLPSLLAVLRSEPGDTPARQNALGALQKCSMRKAAQREMVKGGALEWTVTALAGHARWRLAAARKAHLEHTRDEGLQAAADAEVEAARFRLGAYSVEYATALLMNLSLSRSGKARVMTMPAPKEEGPFNMVLVLLRDTLVGGLMGRAFPWETIRFLKEGVGETPAPLEDEEDDDDDESGALHQVQTYVNGALYSLLTVPEFKKQALGIGLRDVVERLQEVMSEPLRRHLGFILSQLDSTAPPAEDDEGKEDEDEEEEEEPEEDDDEDDDDVGDTVLEEDEDADDTLLPDSRNAELAGETLLIERYSVMASREEGGVGGRGGGFDELVSGHSRSLRPVTPGGKDAATAATAAAAASRLALEDLPPELQSRPKLLRTPPGLSKDRLMTVINETGMSQESMAWGATQEARFVVLSTPPGSKGPMHQEEDDEGDISTPMAQKDFSHLPPGQLPPDTPAGDFGFAVGQNLVPMDGDEVDEDDDGGPRRTLPPEAVPSLRDLESLNDAGPVFASRPKIMRSP